MRLKTIVKKNRISANLAHKARAMRNTSRMKKYGRRLPIDPDKVVFYRAGGGYGDNPRAIAEYIHRHYPEMKLVWAYGAPEDRKTIPDYIHPVVFESEEYLREMSTAGAWVCSTILPSGTQKREGQLYIQTWHGDKGFKKIARDAGDLKNLKKGTSGRELMESKICDYFLTGAQDFIPKIRSALGYEGEVIAHGLPRNDCLVNFDPEAARRIKENLHIPEPTKILIYAPTFRDHESKSGAVASDIDLQAILEAVEKKTGEPWMCLLKAHGRRKLNLAGSKNEKKFLDVTGYSDMADLLMISDMLISDYSSCAGDFALTDHLILLYQDDIDSYTSKDRTLYFDMKDTPFFVAHDLDEAVKIIDQVTPEDIAENCAAIRRFYGVCESGKASEEVVDLIMKNKDKLTKMDDSHG